MVVELVALLPLFLVILLVVKVYGTILNVTRFILLTECIISNLPKYPVIVTPDTILLSLPKYPTRGSRKCKYTNWYALQRAKKLLLQKIREDKKLDAARIINPYFIRPIYLGLGVPKREVKMSSKQKLRYDKKQRALEVRAAISKILLIMVSSE